MEQEKHFLIADGSKNFYNHFENQFGGFSRKLGLVLLFVFKESMQSTLSSSCFHDKHFTDWGISPDSLDLFSMKDLYSALVEEDPVILWAGGPWNIK